MRNDFAETKSMTAYYVASEHTVALKYDFFQAIMKLVHSEEAKLDKASFTGCCYALGNPNAATKNVKKQYQKTLNAFNVYWRAMLLTAWDNLKADYPALLPNLQQSGNCGEAQFVKELRLEFLLELNLNITIFVTNRMSFPPVQNI